MTDAIGESFDTANHCPLVAADVKFSLSFEAMRRSGIARPAGAGRVAEKKPNADGKSIASRTVNGQIGNLRDKIRLVSAAPNRTTCR
jgi:hypothetical protein